MKPGSYLAISLGCKVNDYELSSLRALLESRGYHEDEANPDLVVINTCSVTATADQKSRQKIRKVVNLYPHAVIAVMGCYSQGNADFVYDELKIPIVIGTTGRSRIPDYVDNYLKDGTRTLSIDKDVHHLGYEEISSGSVYSNVRCYLKIEDGCDNFCTYCLIPYRRGNMRSRKLDDILSEARHIASLGYHEIILSGIHIGGYGKDLEGGESFSLLVDLVSRIPGIDRLTISSIEESEIDERLMELLRTRKNIAPHLHIPLQAGCDKTLRRMNRKYDKAGFLRRIEEIRLALPDVMLGTDVIVGFPGETEGDFEESLAFVRECVFDQVHVFPYSRREGTPAYSYPEQVDPSIKKDRVRRMMTLSSSLWDEYLYRHDGKTLSILVESYDEGTGLCHGLSDNYIDYGFKGSPELVNSFVDIKYEYNKK